MKFGKNLEVHKDIRIWILTDDRMKNIEQRNGCSWKAIGELRKRE